MRRVLLFAVASVISLSCATSAEQMDPNTPETCITIDNQEGGMLGRVYLASDAHEGIALVRGTIEPGSQARHCVQRTELRENWWLESRDPGLTFQNQKRYLRPPIYQGRRRASPSTSVYLSPTFYFEPGNDIRWETSKNIIYVNGLRVAGL